MLDVNKVLEDKKEGKLYEAPFTGTLYFGVKDVNGSYDDSSQQRSHYSLSVQNLTNLPEDESSIDKPIEIKLPYSSDNETYTLLGSEGDDDYFSFSVTEEQVVRIDLSAISGTDTSIGVYDMNQFIPEDGVEGKGISEKEKKLIMDELFSGEEPVEPTYYANKGSASEEEALTFTAQPEGKYLLKITNKPSTFYF